KPSIGGPIVWVFGLIRFQQQFIGSSAARQFRVEVVAAFSIGLKHYAASIGRPGGKGIVRGIEGEPRGHTPHGVDEPDVQIAVDLDVPSGREATQLTGSPDILNIYGS